MPLIELSHRLVDCGDRCHVCGHRVPPPCLVAHAGNAVDARVRLASIPEGMGPEDDRNATDKDV